MKTLTLASALLVLAVSQVHAATPELGIDTRRMLSYGTLAVMTGICKTTLTPAQASALNTNLQKAADAQKDMTQDQFTEAMKAVGGQVAPNKEQVCASLTPEFIDNALKEAAAGE